MGQTPAQEKSKEGYEPASRLYRVGGVVLVVLGGLLLSAQRFWGVELPSWLYYAAIGAVIIGVVEWSLGRMSRESARDWNKSLIFALGLALLIRWPIAEPYRIPSGSMEPTLHGDPDFGKGDRVFVNKWIYGVRYPFMNKRIWYGQKPERWDIVVFKSVEPDAEHPTLVKRIVGMPGENIQIAGGNVYVNGEPLEIPEFMPDDMFYTSTYGMLYGVRPEPEYSQIPEGHFLVLGDNSDNSRDGRYFGWLPNEHIVGRVASIWWPPPRWRDFTGFTDTWWWNGLLVLLGAYIVVRLFIGRSWPTLNATRNGIDHVFINFLSHGLRIPLTPWKLKHWGRAERGDLVLYRPVGEAAKGHDFLLGRVAAFAGEEVVIDNGTLKINGEPPEGTPGLDVPVAALGNGNHRYGTAAKGKGKNSVPEGHLFVLTDCPESDEALDSRVIGFVPETFLHGKATCVWWPPTRARKMK